MAFGGRHIGQDYCRRAGKVKYATGDFGSTESGRWHEQWYINLWTFLRSNL